MLSVPPGPHLNCIRGTRGTGKPFSKWDDRKLWIDKCRHVINCCDHLSWSTLSWDCPFNTVLDCFITPIRSDISPSPTSPISVFHCLAHCARLFKSIEVSTNSQKQRIRAKHGSYNSCVYTTDQLDIVYLTERATSNSFYWVGGRLVVYTTVLAAIVADTTVQAATCITHNSFYCWAGRLKVAETTVLACGERCAGC